MPTATRWPLLLATVLALCGITQFARAAEEEPFVFETWSKQKLDAFRGSFQVPENRKAKDSRMIPIHYVRLPATGAKAGPPIVYLAGGPGGSGIEAINYRYRMFMAMRAHGDVIALDQRGTGASDALPECRSKQVVPTIVPVSDEAYAAYHRAALKECLVFWRQNGVDLAGYNTMQNAHDLDALRRHLGVKKIVLWGTSYGSHLALAALKEGAVAPGIDKVVISSVEGLNQTLKLPARNDAYLDRLQAAIDRQPGAKAAYPDLKALMRRVHAKLEGKPVPVKLKTRSDDTVDYLLQRRDLQQMASGMVADPKSVALLLSVYRALDEGVEPPLDRIPARLLPDGLAAPGEPITLQAMPVAMDLASGMTAERRATVRKQAKSAILGSYLDPTLLLDGLAPELDLGDVFRTDPASDIPVLALGGTLDGRTDIDSQREAVSRLRDVTFVTVHNAGHNLFDERSADIQAAIDGFLKSKPVQDISITVELPDMKPAL